MTTVGRPVLLDAETRALVEEFGRGWLIVGRARCHDGSAPKPLLNPHDVPLYVCDAGDHSWGADALDAEAWRTVLASRRPDGWHERSWRECLDGADEDTSPEARRRIIVRLGAIWRVKPITTAGETPTVYLTYPPTP